ncbi:MAG: hypothetical protein R2824_28055 [Saprospiraceae bacterium]|nr:hypothetical protein [Lewinella sp.]
MKIRSSSARGNFKIMNGNWEVVELQFEKWYSHKAVARYRGQQIEICPKGFWSNRFEIIKNGKQIGFIKFEWKGGMVLQLEDADGQMHRYVMKPKGVLKFRFELTNEAGELLLALRADGKWYNPGMSYAIERTEQELPFDEAEFLLYCGFTARVQMQQMAA